MAPQSTRDLHVDAVRPLVTPAALINHLPLSEAGAATVAATREQIRAVIAGHDRRLLVVVGPCSIHDVDAAKDYAAYLADKRREHEKRLLILMRVYFEKPRTTLGWKGLINDPHLDGSYDLEAGLRCGRRLLVELAEAGMPAASEVLDPIVPQYLGDVIAWAAIGARTIESQTHREMASGLSMPIGLKNGTEGNLMTAINAMKSAARPHHFLGIDLDGRVAMVATKGNPDTHLVLRGGAAGPNYDEPNVRAAAEQLKRLELCPRVMIDTSHDNSSKDYTRQPAVCAEIAAQLRRGAPVLGAMIESNLVAGKQAFPPSPGVPLRRGQSITDGCVDLPTTSAMLAELAAAVG